MSVAIDFEKTLLQLLKDDNKSKEDNVSTSEIKNKRVESKGENNIEYSNHDLKKCIEKKEFTVPPAVSLFAGICIGVGLASHSLIIQWK